MHGQINFGCVEGILAAVTRTIDDEAFIPAAVVASRSSEVQRRIRLAGALGTFNVLRVRLRRFELQRVMKIL